MCQFRTCNLVESPFQHVAEQFVARVVAVPVPLVLNETLGVVSLNLIVQTSERMCEQSVEVAVLSTSFKTVCWFWKRSLRWPVWFRMSQCLRRCSNKGTSLVLQQRVRRRITEQIVALPAPLKLEDIVEAESLMPNERHWLLLPVPNVLEEIVEVVRPVPLVAEQLFDVPKIASPRIMKEMLLQHRNIKQPERRPELLRKPAGRGETAWNA